MVNPHVMEATFYRPFAPSLSVPFMRQDETHLLCGSSLYPYSSRLAFLDGLKYNWFYGKD